MNRTKTLKATERFVKDALQHEATGHDWWHIARVLNNAELICKSEKADQFIVRLALLLHDVGDRKVIHAEEDDYSIAENFLIKQGIPTELRSKVMFIIENMSFSKSLTSKREDAPIEFYIAQDADRLDAMGAIGVARVFAYGGSRGRPLYDPTKKPQKPTTTKKYRQLNSSSLHHFDEKLFLLRDLMNTKTARKIAERRHKYMKEYVKQFLQEWDGRK